MNLLLIDELLDLAELEREISAGYVTRRLHPEFPELAILNYADKCQYENRWTSVTRQTRGLIYNTDTGVVLARPFAKFFNYGDAANGADLDPDRPVLSVHDKWDGSLGIAYQRPDGRYAIATRGSFESEQALHATALIDANPNLLPVPTTRETDLFEIIYPGNRIVLDYGDRDELIHLGFVHNRSGQFYPNHHPDDPGAFGSLTIRDVINLPDRPNREGWVVWLDTTTAVKFKQDDYLALHRVVSNLTVKEVWRQLRDGTFDTFAAALPDEFHKWANETAAPLIGTFHNTLWSALFWLNGLKQRDLPDRKSQALWNIENTPEEYRGLVFGLLDGKDVSASIWRMLEPKSE